MPAAPTNPLFLTNRAELIELIRGSGVPEGSDAAEIFNQAILEARIRFNATLGVARIQEIQATPFNANPVSTEQYERASAAVCETKVVRKFLLSRLVHRTQDGAADTIKVWQEEAPGRDLSSFELEDTLKRLEDEIDVLMQSLVKQTVPDYETRARGYISPLGTGQDRRPRISDQLYPPGS